MQKISVALAVLFMKIRNQRNWSQYNQRLINIARVDFYLSKEAIDQWYYLDKRDSGGKKIYSDHVIELSLLIKEFYNLPYRQTQGFLDSILSMSGYDLSVPNYTRLSRRCEKLSLKIKSNNSKIASNKDPIVVAVDSTGLSLYNYSDWHNLKHKDRSTKNIDRWRKLHIAIDVKTGEILSALPTGSKEYDGKQLPYLLDNIKEDIDSVCADMAYDNYDCRKVIAQRKAKQLIPPRRRAVQYTKNHYYRKNLKDSNILKERDEAIKYIKTNTTKTIDQENARSLWKKKVGYHQRSLVESTMYQIKVHSSDRLTNKKEITRDVQSLIKCKLVNMINAA